MRKTGILLIALLIVSVSILGCSSDNSKITGRTTVDASSPDDDGPSIDRSYNTKSSAPTRTTTKTTTTTTSSMSTEDRVEQIASDYIKKLSGYRDYNGRNIKIKTISKNSGDGNFIVEAVFTRDPIGSKYATEEPINVHLSIKKWKADSYTFN